ncbi:glycosyltransferase, partial [Streptomyces scabiei]|uniref:glycosyltransferase n=1 Tax=Streptomyces scabiei TaxID=1930 RepID=UPI0038F6B52D
VATAVGGNGELIDSGVNGILVQPADADVFAEALANVLRNPDLALALSERSRQKVEEKFDSRNLAAAFLRCLRASQMPGKANV